jgi:hypothetical protein
LALPGPRADFEKYLEDIMAFFSASEGCSPDDADKMVDIFGGPHQVDQFVRQAIQFCWTSLPKDRRTPEELEKQLRRLVDRALKDFREDRDAFGK